MTRALPFCVQVSGAGLHGQPGAHMHGEKRDKARLWKDKNAFNYTCCMFVYIKKTSFIFRKILVCFLAGNTYWYTKDQPTVIS